MRPRYCRSADLRMRTQNALLLAATARVIWLCAYVRYWPGPGLVYVSPLL